MPDIDFDLNDTVTWKHGHRPLGIDWETAIVQGINYADGIAEVAVQDGSRPYELTFETEQIWVGALYKAEEK